MSTPLTVAAYRWSASRQEREAAAVTLRALSPDALVVHGVPGHPLAGHRIAGFADRLDLMWSGGPHRHSGGTTVLTALRVDVLDERHLPLAPRGHSGYAVTRLRLPGHRTVRVVGAHLSAEDGAAELARLREHVAEPAADGAPLVALSADVGTERLVHDWPDLTAAVVPVPDPVASAVVDLDEVGAG
jgi:hypothetical protein